MRITYGREAFKKAKRSGLSGTEIQRCEKAIGQFRDNPHHPGLNFERLGSNSGQNHWSIRASQELRVILAIDQLRDSPEPSVLVANFGHHDPVYDWALRQGYYTPIDSGFAPEGDSQEGGSSASLQALTCFEEWQLYLHEDQKSLVNRGFGREARIRGGTGTGKTVIGLHRAARLGREHPEGKILVTSFHQVLVKRLKDTFAGFPDLPANVEFLTIFQLARRVLGPFAADRKMIDVAFEGALEEVVPGSSLETCSATYLREEIERVIKGRAATRDEYLDTDRFQRVGRQRAFKKRDRDACWKLSEVWDRYMSEAGTQNFPDVLIAAMELAEQSDSPKYRAVLIDEGQDVTAVGMRLLRAVVAGHPRNEVPANGLLLLEDRAQQIYPGGFRPAWAKLDFKGRSHRLEHGRRTTRQISLAAAAIRGQWLVDKSDEEDVAVHSEHYDHDGPMPCWIQVQPRREISEAARIVRQLIDQDGLEAQEIGVLMHRGNDTEECYDEFRKRGIQAVNLKGQSRTWNSDAKGVGVVTLDSCKGLEFRAVLILRLGRSLFPLTEDDRTDLAKRHGQERLNEEWEPPLDAEAREKLQLNLDRLYVGMTRACERLYLISSESPGSEIEEAREYLDWYDARRPFDLFSQHQQARA